MSTLGHDITHSLTHDIGIPRTLAGPSTFSWQERLNRQSRAIQRNTPPRMQKVDISNRFRHFHLSYPSLQDLLCLLISHQSASRTLHQAPSKGGNPTVLPSPPCVDRPRPQQQQQHHQLNAGSEEAVDGGWLACFKAAELETWNANSPGAVDQRPLHAWALYLQAGARGGGRRGGLPSWTEYSMLLYLKESFYRETLLGDCRWYCRSFNCTVCG